jgi:hypothetical protein
VLFRSPPRRRCQHILRNYRRPIRQRCRQHRCLRRQPPGCLRARRIDLQDQCVHRRRQCMPLPRLHQGFQLFSRDMPHVLGSNASSGSPSPNLTNDSSALARVNGGDPVDPRRHAGWWRRQHRHRQSSSGTKERAANGLGKMLRAASCRWPLVRSRASSRRRAQPGGSARTPGRIVASFGSARLARVSRGRVLPQGPS